MLTVIPLLLVGIDWAERHHDVCVMASDGSVLARERIADGVAGLARLHELIAVHASDPVEVVVGIETDRACWRSYRERMIPPPQQGDAWIAGSSGPLSRRPRIGLGCSD